MNSKIGVTLGEPFGIGPEIVFKFLDTHESYWPSITLFANRENVATVYKSLFFADPRWLYDVAFSEEDVAPFPTFKDDHDGRADFCLSALNAASSAALKGQVGAIVTAPLDKAMVRVRLRTFTGHTEYLAERAGVKKTVMLLDNEDLAVALLTNHVALKDVSRELSQDRLIEVATIVDRSFRSLLSRKIPKMALLGLNPHAGEIVENSEEETIFKPALVRMQELGLNIEGPFPADSFFPHARQQGGWDVILSPYHDQGLVAVKYQGIDRVVNVTLGLPYLRVSPGHGVAYDIAGKGVARIESFKRAVDVAMTRRLKNDTH